MSVCVCAIATGQGVVGGIGKRGWFGVENKPWSKSKTIVFFCCCNFALAFIKMAPRYLQRAIYPVDDMSSIMLPRLVSCYCHFTTVLDHLAYGLFLVYHSSMTKQLFFLFYSCSFNHGFVWGNKMFIIIIIESYRDDNVLVFGEGRGGG